MSGKTNYSLKSLIQVQILLQAHVFSLHKISMAKSRSHMRAYSNISLCIADAQEKIFIFHTHESIMWKSQGDDQSSVTLGLVITLSQYPTNQQGHCP